MVKKITNPQILKVIDSIGDKKVKTVLLSEGDSCLCSLKFLRKHEEVFRSSQFLYSVLMSGSGSCDDC